MKPEKKSWMNALFAYAEGERKRLALSVVLSVLSVMLGLVRHFVLLKNCRLLRGLFLLSQQL